MKIINNPDLPEREPIEPAAEENAERPAEVVAAKTEIFSKENLEKLNANSKYPSTQEIAARLARVLLGTQGDTKHDLKSTMGWDN